MPRWRVAFSASLASGTLLLEGFPNLTLAAVSAPLGVEGAVLVDAVVRVRTEEVALCLDQGGRQPLGANAVVVGQRGGERGRRNPVLRSTRHDSPPRCQAVAHRFGEVVIGKQQRQVGIALVRLGDAVQEARPDDAAATPDPSP